MEIWLRPNRRALVMGMIFPDLLTIAGVLLLAGIVPLPGRWGIIAGVLLVALGGLGIVLLAWQMTLPRVAYRDGQVLFFLQSRGPVAVPVGVVEGFLLGQGPALLPGQRRSEDQVANVVVRLAEKAADWRHVDVKRSLGHWCDGYITIRGTWCEPLDESVVKELNRRLGAAHRQQAGQPA